MEKFISNVLPGNYWITKSMEFSRITKSGTLWYLKKWFVFYQYIFLKKEMHETDYIEISVIFDNFIDSLDDSVKDTARSFFYEVDIKSKFTRMSSFCDTNGKTFTSEKEKKQFITEAKKFYFMYVMGLGGQQNYKKDISELIHQNKKYHEIIEQMTIKMRDAGMKEGDIRTQFSDFHAALRNERQIFFYYGFFNGVEKADLSGFYTITKLGKSIINSTIEELIIVWEHQKIKMVSQNPDTTIDMGKHKKSTLLNYNNFSINYHPYLTFLKSVSLLKEIKFEIYQFVISRTTHVEEIQHILTNLNTTTLNTIKRKVNSFKRKGDVAKEDFHKEIKKFTLGISDLPLDNKTNPFSFLNKEGLKVLNEDKLNFTIKCYETISKYLDFKNRTIYESFENDLKKYYVSQIENTKFEHDPEALYEWHRYIVSPETPIILSLIYVHISLCNNNFNFNLSAKEIKNEFKKFKNILALVGIQKVNDYIDNIQRVQQELLNSYLNIDLNYAEDMDIDYAVFNRTISEEKLIKISNKIKDENNLLRKRSSELIHAVKGFYIKNFKSSSDNLIACDACKGKTFITKNGYAYLEFHHLIPFSTDNGPDHYLNIFGICPTCHRKFHHATKTAKKELYSNISSNNNPLMALDIRFNKLYEEGVLEPLNLEFLRKEEVISEEIYKNYMEREFITK